MFTKLDINSEKMFVPFHQYNSTSRVEEIALERSKKKLRYEPYEKISIIEVPNVPNLGKITALRFLEWLQLNPEGVISLPTGKTPEFFIRWTTKFLQQWNEKDIQQELASWGLNPAIKPDMRSFTFVQIDEFFPMDPARNNSFAAYINRFYIKDFGLDPKKALLMNTWDFKSSYGNDLGVLFPDGKIDLSLRYRASKNNLESDQQQAIIMADEQAMAYEDRIKSLGGIGFFLGGIGPDGHIAFNIKGSDHHSTTRLLAVNYETAAAAANDLGGIEVARDRVVMTIGLATITHNVSATAIVFAAGEAKGKVIQDAVEHIPSVSYPATVLQKLSGARFYLTRGAACLLPERTFDGLRTDAKAEQLFEDRTLVDVATKKRKKLSDLMPDDLVFDRNGSLVTKKINNLSAQATAVADRIKNSIQKGLAEVSGLSFLHTAPHHDDIMLGYLPYLARLSCNLKNVHNFVTLTSGFNAVTNDYTVRLLNQALSFLSTEEVSLKLQNGYFDYTNPALQDHDLSHYLDALAASDEKKKQAAESARLVRNLASLFKTQDAQLLIAEIEKLKLYFQTSYPGKKDIALVQTFKGMIREWEDELLWAHLGFGSRNVYHLRLGFYTGDIFTPQPGWDNDIKPVFELLEKTVPDVVTVALDPEGSGPDTHYKVLLSVCHAVKAYVQKYPERKLRVWGYRNVWFKFHPAEADIVVPVSLNSFAVLKNGFHACFASQRTASFPNTEYDGPFCDITQKVMAEQYCMIKTVLGSDYFEQHQNPCMRSARGFNLLRDMDPETFFEHVLSLQKQMEL